MKTIRTLAGMFLIIVWVVVFAILALWNNKFDDDPINNPLPLFLTYILGFITWPLMDWFKNTKR